MTFRSTPTRFTANCGISWGWGGGISWGWGGGSWGWGGGISWGWNWGGGWCPPVPPCSPCPPPCDRCFCTGVDIRVPGGEKTVEALQIGDRVLTYVDGQAVERSIVWVGGKTKQVNASLPLDEAGYPVRIMKDAVAPNVPERDLLVTAEHCLFFDGRFIPARMLVNGRSIFYDLTMTEYDYYHIETQEHSVLWSNGMLSESFLDTGNRRSFDQHGRIVSFGGRPARTWENDAAAPLTVERELVEPVYRSLEERAVSLDLVDQSTTVELTEDADLHLVTADGQRFDVVRRAEGNRHVFTLPAGVTDVRIVSRASRPWDVQGPFVDDRRSLGVLVGDVKLWTEDGVQTLSDHLTTETLSGWHGIENAAARWSNGNARISLPQRSGLSLSVLSIEIVAAGPYIVEEQTAARSAIAS